MTEEAKQKFLKGVEKTRAPAGGEYLLDSLFNYRS